MLSRMHILAAAVIGAGSLASLSFALADSPNFGITSHQFTNEFNKVLAADHFDQAKHCRSVSGSLICSFDDAAFKSTLKTFKTLNLMNGRFNLDLRLEVVSEGNKVTQIKLDGVRSDPVNMLEFIATVGDILMTFEPDMSQSDLGDATKQLGLMRGDDDPTIGQQKTDIFNRVEADCNQSESSVSSAMECAFIPRS